MTVQKCTLIVMKGKKIWNLYNLVGNLEIGGVARHGVNSDSGSATVMCAHSDHKFDCDFIMNLDSGSTTVLCAHSDCMCDHNFVKNCVPFRKQRQWCSTICQKGCKCWWSYLAEDQLQGRHHSEVQGCLELDILGG